MIKICITMLDDDDFEIVSAPLVAIDSNVIAVHGQKNNKTSGGKRKRVAAESRGVKCPLCHMDMSSLSLFDQTYHTNNCLDQQVAADMPLISTEMAKPMRKRPLNSKVNSDIKFNEIVREGYRMTAQDKNMVIEEGLVSKVVLPGDCILTDTNSKIVKDKKVTSLLEDDDSVKMSATDKLLYSKRMLIGEYEAKVAELMTLKKDLELQKERVLKEVRKLQKIQRAEEERELHSCMKQQLIATETADATGTASRDRSKITRSRIISEHLFSQLSCCESPRRHMPCIKKGRTCRIVNRESHFWAAAGSTTAVYWDIMTSEDMAAFECIGASETELTTKIYSDDFLREISSTTNASLPVPKLNLPFYKLSTCLEVLSVNAQDPVLSPTSQKPPIAETVVGEADDYDFIIGDSPCVVPVNVEQCVEKTVDTLSLLRWMQCQSSSQWDALIDEHGYKGMNSFRDLAFILHRCYEASLDGCDVAKGVDGNNKSKSPCDQNDSTLTSIASSDVCAYPATQEEWELESEIEESEPVTQRRGRRPGTKIGIVPSTFCSPPLALRDSQMSMADMNDRSLLTPDQFYDVD